MKPSASIRHLSAASGPDGPLVHSASLTARAWKSWWRTSAPPGLPRRWPPLADVVILSVPIPKVTEVAREVAPFLSPPPP